MSWYGEFAGDVPAGLPALPPGSSPTSPPAAVRRPNGNSPDTWRTGGSGSPPRRPDRHCHRTAPGLRCRLHRGRSLPFTIDATTTAALGGLARSAGATVNAAVLAGLSALLGQTTGQDDYCCSACRPPVGRAPTWNR